MILVIGSVVVRDGRLAEAIALSQEHVTRSRAEPGCKAHAVHQDTENPNRLVFVEQWSTAPPSMSVYEAIELQA
jgi:quinol monooxygenase YgiN